MTALNKKAHGKGWDRRGVSEILANILILGITVTLFSTVIGFVSTVPEADDPVQVEMEASLDGDLLSVAHKGGSTLPADSDVTRVRIVADGVARFVPLHYGTTSDGSEWDQEWSVGRTWYFNFTDNAINVFQVTDQPFEPSTVTVGVAYIDQGNIIWSSTLKTDSDNPPRITSFKVDGTNSTGTTIQWGDTVTIKVTVKDSDGDMDTVTGNLDSLFKTAPGTIAFTNAGGETWQATGLTPTANNGTKVVSITATDESGNTDREFYQATVFSASGGTTPPDNPPDDNQTVEDPTIPGGGNPEESPPDFFVTEMNQDFFIYSYQDWLDFKIAVSGGQPAPEIRETFRYNVSDRFFLVFKINISDLGNAHRTSREGEATIANPTALPPWGSYLYDGGNNPFTSATSLINDGIEFQYMEHEVTFTPQMENNGGKVYARTVTGPNGQAAQRIWHGHGVVNPYSGDKISVTSENITGLDTKYFKAEDNTIRFDVFIPNSAGVEWYPHNPWWGGPFYDYNIFGGPVRIHNLIGGSPNNPSGEITYPEDTITISKPSDDIFQFEIDRSGFSTILDTGWNTVFVEVTYMMVDDEGLVLEYAFGYKFYVEV